MGKNPKNNSTNKVDEKKKLVEIKKSEQTMDELMGLVEQANSGGKVKSIDEIKAELNYEKEKFEKKIGRGRPRKLESSGVGRQAPEPVEKENFFPPSPPPQIVIKESSSKKVPVDDPKACDQMKHKIRSLYMRTKKYKEVKMVQVDKLDNMTLEQLYNKYDELRSASMGYGAGFNIAQSVYVRGLDITERMVSRFDPATTGMTALYLHPFDEETMDAKCSIDRCLEVIDHELFSGFTDVSNPYIRLAMSTWHLADVTKSKALMAQQQVEMKKVELEIEKIKAKDENVNNYIKQIEIEDPFLEQQMNDLIEDERVNEIPENIQENKENEKKEIEVLNQLEMFEEVIYKEVERAPVNNVVVV